MKKLITLVVMIGAAAAVVLFWRKNRRSWDSTWSSAKDTTSSWGKNAADQAGKAADTLSGAAAGVTDKASDAADELRDSLDG